MKTIKVFSIFFCILLMLSACEEASPPSDAETPSAASVAAVMLAAQPELPPLYAVRFGEDGFSDYASLYVSDTEAVADGTICYPYGVDATEIVVFEFADEASARSAAEEMESYLAARASAFEGYAPGEAALVEKGRTEYSGRTAVLAVCIDPDAAAEAFRSCMEGTAATVTLDEFLASGPEDPSGEPEAPSEEREEPHEEPGNPSDEPDGTAEPSETPGEASASPEEPSVSSEEPSEIPEGPSDEPEPVTSPDTEVSELTTEEPPSAKPEEPPEEDVYDGGAVLRAWETGDASGLTGKNAAVYERAAGIIAELITDGMSDYEKELAIHDRIISCSEYDPAVLYPGLGGEPDPDNTNPYGLLCGGRAICSGYSGTFQMFMDMLGIECITVRGTANPARDEHAWNMVRLDGEWYCVDVTWDDPVGLLPLHSDEEKHEFFNVTSDYMRKTNHFWDEENVPEAAADKYAWKK